MDNEMKEWLEDLFGGVVKEQIEELISKVDKLEDRVKTLELDGDSNED